MPSRNRGTPKPKLRDLSRQPPSNEEVASLFETLESPHPITRAILGAVLIEHELEKALRDALPRNDDVTWSLLTGDRGALGTFMTKIDLGFALKLYEDELRKTLHILRGVRNAFAHAKRLVNSEHELILKELQSIPPYRPTKPGNLVYVSKKQRQYLTQAQTSGDQTWTILVYILSTAFMRANGSKMTNRLRALKRQRIKLMGPNLLLNQLFERDYPQSFQADQNVDPKTEVLPSTALSGQPVSRPKRSRNSDT